MISGRPASEGFAAYLARYQDQPAIKGLRRVLHALEPGASLELLIDKIRATKSNEQFLKEISKAPGS